MKWVILVNSLVVKKMDLELNSRCPREYQCPDAWKFDA
jgi:hypothetical protein